MTTVDPALSRPATLTSRSDVKAVPFSRLVLVEWRKQLDTRAGRWLLIVIAIVTAGVMLLMGAVGSGDVSFEAFLIGTTTPLGMLLPIVAILAATSEWSQRTALTTFTLEPRRLRVIGAKTLSAVGSGVGFYLVAVGLAALAHLWVVSFRGADADWDVTRLTYGTLLMVVLWMIGGIAFGLAFLSTPMAIVTYLVLPVVVSTVALFVTAWADVWPWIDLSTAAAPLAVDPDLAVEMGMSSGGEMWAQIATATLIWVGLPMAIGVWRVLRGEIKTA
ncbi:ABC transporter permease [Isoptericola jiangsuensis]|uniref:ABC transporter permease n=1 Tax=Isoptericola jiangsuensis TaxID=548579 RepID=UPI003AADB1D8